MGISDPNARPAVKAMGKRQVEAHTRPIAPLGCCEKDPPPDAEIERCDAQGTPPTVRVASEADCRVLRGRQLLHHARRKSTRRAPCSGGTSPEQVAHVGHEVDHVELQRAPDQGHRLGGRVEPARLEDPLADLEEQVAGLFERCLVAAQPDGYAQLKGQVSRGEIDRAQLRQTVEQGGPEAARDVRDHGPQCDESLYHGGGPGLCW